MLKLRGNGVEAGERLRIINVSHAPKAQRPTCESTGKKRITPYMESVRVFRLKGRKDCFYWSFERGESAFWGGWDET